MDRYHYQALSQTDSIRLLCIGQDDSKPHAMSLSLREVRLADEPEFSAVSYTWQLPEYSPGNLGDDPGPGQDYVVECDGKTITISENLFQFLRTAVTAMDRRSAEQGRGEDLGPRKRPKTAKSSGFLETLRKWPLWIDAFCINQSDPRERQHQVLLMDKIYSRAETVLVWLGDTEPGHDLIWVHDVFIPLLAKISARSPSAMANFVADPLCKSASAVELLGKDICSRWAFSWLSFANFLDRRRWFHRGWIVQEVALGRADKVLLLCGHKELRWTRLTAFSHFLHLTGWSRSLRGAYNTTIGLHNLGTVRTGKASIGAKIRAIDEAHRMITSKPTQHASTPTEWYHCASDLISKLRSSQFEDPRDHIYGCLGMLSQMLPAGFSNPIIPNYEKTVPEVYTSVAAMFLTNMPGLSELSKVEDPSYRSQQLIPSWVPDYSVPHRGNLGLGDISLAPATTPGQGDLSTTAPIPVVIGTGLMVRAAKYAFIHEMTLTDPWSDVASFHNALLELLLEAQALHHTNLVWDFWTTLARGNLDTYRNNRQGTSDIAPISIPIPLKSIVTRTTHWNTENLPRTRVDKRFIADLTRISQRELNPENSELQEAARMLLNLFRQISVERPLLGEEPLAAGIWDILSSAALYVTKGGRLGVGPVSTSSKTGDEIWILEGIDRFFVLRKASTGLDSWSKDEYDVQAYHLVGETFIHGVNVKEQMLEAKEEHWVSIILL